MPSAQDYATIGHLYEAIRANLTALDLRLGSYALFLGGEAAQVGREVIDLDGISPITDLASAIAAIDIVVEQGEGSSSDKDESQYRSFLEIREELAEFERADPGFAPAWPVAESPVLRRWAEPNGMLFVDHPDAVPLLDFACAGYGLLLRCLVQCFGRSGSNSLQSQKLLMSAAINMMRVVGEASSLLARRPATSDDPNVHAGMTFTMLRGVEPLLGGEAERRLLSERVADLIRIASHVMPGANAGLEKVRGALARL